MSVVLKTDRLHLRPPTYADAVPLRSCFGDQQLMQFWLNGYDATFAATQARAEGMITHWQKHGFGDWVVVEESTQQVIGICGLHFIEKMTEVNLGYVLQRSSHTRGYAIEASRAALEYGLNTMGLGRIVAVIDPANTASRRVAERLEMTQWKETTWMGQTRVIYSRQLII